MLPALEQEAKPYVQKAAEWNYYRKKERNHPPPSRGINFCPAPLTAF